MKKIFILFAIVSTILSCTTQKKLGTKNRIVLVETSYGDMKIKLYDETPKHRDNFISLTADKFYNRTLFHRVINEFMIQGGDPDSRDADSDKDLGEGGPGYKIEAEFNTNLFHKKGVLAAAREGDSMNPERKSAGSQFYIAQGKVYTNEELDIAVRKINKRRENKIFNAYISENAEKLADIQTRDIKKYYALYDSLQNDAQKLMLKEKYVLSDAQRKAYTTVGGIPHLDGQYTVFGEVIEGLDVLDKIAAVNVNNQNRPLEDIEMEISIIK
ncbi:MAG: peptidylprolyl isomerase [Marinifilaceae bacterium]